MIMLPKGTNIPWTERLPESFFNSVLQSVSLVSDRSGMLHRETKVLPFLVQFVWMETAVCLKAMPPVAKSDGGKEATGKRKSFYREKNRT